MHRISLRIATESHESNSTSGRRLTGAGMLFALIFRVAGRTFRDAPSSSRIHGSNASGRGRFWFASVLSLVLFAAAPAHALEVYLGGAYASVGSEAAADARAECITHATCTSYQWNPNGSVAGASYYRQFCGPLDPWGSPHSGLDDDEYRQVYVGLDWGNGNTVACYPYDYGSRTCAGGTPSIGGTCVSDKEPNDEKNVGECQDCVDRPIAGNPVNFAQRNKFQKEMDYAGSGPMP